METDLSGWNLAAYQRCNPIKTLSTPPFTISARAFGRRFRLIDESAHLTEEPLMVSGDRTWYAWRTSSVDSRKK
jgi:hypothetical protein